MTEKQRDAGGAPAAAALPRSPTEKPPFTFADIRNAVPPHCFRRSLLRSSAYLLRDLAISGCFLWFALAVIPALPLGLHLAAWPLYWAAQGSVLFGVWVIAHECGHGAFSDYPLLNDAVGLLLHSALLAPYFSWKYSHLRHHAHTCSLDRDEVYVPCRRRDLPWYSERLYGGEEDRPAARLALLAVQLTVGWPMYLVFNTWGRAYPRWASHLDPSSPIYSGGRERAHVAVSDAGLVAAAVALARLAAARGFWWVARVYGAPLLVVNAWLVVVTYLHHTHAALPRYAAAAGGDAGWDWLRGALATVDRDYGAVGRAFIHNIADTHVAHHLFPTIPHYHAVEATKAIRPVLGEYYRFDPTPIAMALWREVKECIYVEPDEDGVFWFSNKF